MLFRSLHLSQNQKKRVLTTRRNKLFSAFCKKSCTWTPHKFDFTQCIELASEKKTNTDRSLLASFAEKTEIRFLPGRRKLKREVQKSDRINSDRQSVLACEQAFSRAAWGEGKAPPFLFPFLAIFPQTESLFTG